MTRLSVNLNKVAVLRNARGGALPSVTRAARICMDAGCHGITLHPRPDLRHIRPDDIRDLQPLLTVELNLEGNPFSPAQANGYPGFLALLGRHRPAQCTFVPDQAGQLTSDHGFNLRQDAEALRPLIAQARGHGCRVSLFVDAGCPDLALARAIGADCIEIYTGPYAEAFARGQPEEALARCVATAEQARALGLEVHAGHDLDQRNLRPLAQAIPFLAEVSIGHALIAEALEDGLAPTVHRYLQLLR